MNYLKIQICLLTVLSFFLFVISAAAQENNDKFRITYDDEKDRTVVILNGIKLPKNKDSFSVGGSFEFAGKTPEKMPCCAVLYFTSISKKKFKFQENHNLKIWADKEIYDLGKINWQESFYAYAFILSGVAYPEEIYVGMETEKLLKIINAKKVKAQLGNFKFNFTDQQLNGLRDLVAKVKSGEIQN